MNIPFVPSGRPTQTTYSGGAVITPTQPAFWRVAKKMKGPRCAALCCFSSVMRKFQLRLMVRRLPACTLAPRSLFHALSSEIETLKRLAMEKSVSPRRTV